MAYDPNCILKYGHGKKCETSTDVRKQRVRHRLCCGICLTEGIAISLHIPNYH